MFLLARFLLARFLPLKLDAVAVRFPLLKFQALPFFYSSRSSFLGDFGSDRDVRNKERNVGEKSMKESTTVDAEAKSTMMAISQLTKDVRLCLLFPWMESVSGWNP